MADTADAGVVGIAGLRGAAGPTIASPRTVGADSADAGVGGLTWAGGAAVPPFASRRNALAKSYNKRYCGVKESLPPGTRVGGKAAAAATRRRRIAIKKNLLGGSEVAIFNDAEVATTLVVLEPRGGNVVRVAGRRVHDGREPRVLAAGAAVARLTNGERLVIGSGVVVVEGLVAVVEGAGADGAAGVAVDADQVNVASAGPVLSDGLDAVAVDIGRPPHLDERVARHCSVHQLPGVDELRRRALVRSGVQVPVHLVSEAQPHLDALISELLEHVGHVCCCGRCERAQRQRRHHGGLEHGPGADHVIHHSCQLAAVEARTRHLRIPAVPADLATKRVVELCHTVLRRRDGRVAVAGQSPKRNIVDIDAVRRQTVSYGEAVSFRACVLFRANCA